MPKTTKSSWKPEAGSWKLDSCRQLLHMAEASGHHEDRSKKERVIRRVDDEAAGHRSRFGAHQREHAANDEQHQQRRPGVGQLSFMKEGENQGIHHHRSKEPDAPIQSGVEEPAEEKLLEERRNENSKDGQQPG